MKVPYTGIVQQTWNLPSVAVQCSWTNHGIQSPEMKAGCLGGLYSSAPAPQGWPGQPWPPHILALLPKNGDLCMYLGQFNSCQHCRGQHCASTRCKFLLMLKKESVVFWTHSQTQTEGVVFWTHSQMQSCDACWDKVYNHRPTSACTTYREHFQYWSACMRALREHFQYWFTMAP